MKGCSKDRKDGKECGKDAKDSDRTAFFCDRITDRKLMTDSFFDKKFMLSENEFSNTKEYAKASVIFK